MSITIEQLTAAYEQDQTDKRSLVTIEDIPLTYESITPEWLTLVLCSKHPGTQVVSYRLGAIDNGTSDRRRIFIEYNEVGEKAAHEGYLPDQVFCKATQSLSARITLGLSGALQTEVNFYNKVRPLMPINAPISLFANFNDRLNSIIVLREFDKGTISCTHTTDITRTLAESQMRLLGTFHGKFLDSPELKTTLAIFPTWTDFFRDLSNRWEEGCDQGFAIAEEVIPARLFARRKDIWPATLASIECHRHLPHTLIHSDVHVRNWHITPKGEMGLHDWQAATRGHWARDVIYAMTTSLTVEKRRQWQDELLRYYHDQLQEAAQRKVSTDDMFNEIRRQLLSVLAFWTITINPGPGITDLQPQDSILEFIRRISVAIDDLDALDSFQ